jgi:methionyl-tRNA synthetase
VYVHGFITVSGDKMSKSRGTGISPLRYLEIGMNPEWLRYYIAAKLNANVEDIDFNPDDFLARVNSDLVGKYVNIASRCARFLVDRFEGRAAAGAAVPGLDVPQLSGEIAAAFEARDYGRAIRLIMSAADRVNAFIDAEKPWELAKAGGPDARLQQICSAGLQAFKALTVWLKPVLPRLAERAEAFLGSGELSWEDAAKPLERINPYSHLLKRVELEKVNSMVEANKEQAAAKTGEAAPQAEYISIDEFRKVDLRVARIANAEHVEGADKLLRLTLDLGTGQRTVFAGIKSAYAPEQLVGRLTVMVANLQPRKMRFGVSEGMVLAAGGDGPGLFLLTPDEGAAPGMRIT